MQDFEAISFVFDLFLYFLIPPPRFFIFRSKLAGEIPDLPLEFRGYPQIDLSSNLFHGKAPSFFSASRSLYLSNNSFTELASLLCTREAEYLFLLDLSINQLSELPSCWKTLPSLSFLSLEDNNLSGTIPTSLGHLNQIQALHLLNNQFVGEMPLELSNCTELKILDVAYNSLKGPIPMWIGDNLQNLMILSLKSNEFYGAMPSNICLLAQVQILDLSLNNISGSIPRCVKHLTALASQRYSEMTTISYYYNGAESSTFAYVDSALVTWKGRDLEYKSTLGLLKFIDLSSNKLVGKIPSEIINLVGLSSLNLSRNRLTGKIPSNIGELRLDALDLSRNFLFGSIPSSLSKMGFLGVLDLSFNNLSGKIPMGTQIQTFNATVFMGNSELCGQPLPKKCPDEHTDDDHNYDNDKDDDDQFIDKGFYISMALGFVVGLWGFWGTLLFKRSWRHAYFNFLSNKQEWLSEFVATKSADLQKRLKSFKDKYLMRNECLLR